MNCPKCGVEINPEQVLCVKCGYQIREIKKEKKSNAGCIIGVIVGVFLLVFFGGILAAIAYPQYVMAVEKSRTALSVTVMKNLADSQTRHMLSHGKYTSDFSQLDIDVPEATVNGNTAESDLFIYEIALPYIKATRKDNSNFQYTLSYEIQTGEVKCEGSEFICKYF